MKDKTALVTKPKDHFENKGEMLEEKKRYKLPEMGTAFSKTNLHSKIGIQNNLYVDRLKQKSLY